MFNDRFVFLVAFVFLFFLKAEPQEDFPKEKKSDSRSDSIWSRSVEPFRLSRDDQVCQFSILSKIFTHTKIPDSLVKEASTLIYKHTILF